MPAMGGLPSLAGVRLHKCKRLLWLPNNVLQAQRFVYTDIGRDCTLAGPNPSALAEMQQAVTPHAFIVSSGVGSFADLKVQETLSVGGR